MRWPWRASRTRRMPSLALDEIDQSTLEVIELDDGGRRIGGPEPVRVAAPEVAYGPRSPDPTGLAGIWEALERA